jgi:hypothetical protein
MIEKAPREINGAPAKYPDWPTLVGRAVDDVSRILQSELHMFQAKVGAELQARIANTVASLTIAAMVISGTICLLCASILLLHQWLPWWEAFGIAGLAMLLVATARNVAMRNVAHTAPEAAIFLRPAPTKPAQPEDSSGTETE